ncbi:MAG: DUF3794 domain-containing protein [Firmicutes bacterium]|nr:DUF3794 domain-containing protein [Bacillota bacterium]
MDVNKQSINVGKAVWQGDIRGSAEGSIIVPDVKPDILKVLQVDADTFITEKQIENGKITISGKVNVTVLYVPESVELPIESIHGTFEFCETLKRSEFSENMRFAASADAEKVSYKPINSRKVGIEAQICISVQVIAEKNYAFVSGIEDDCAQFMTDCIRLCSTEECRDFNFEISDTAELPEGKSSIGEILRSNVMISEKECRALQGKLVVKGKANAYILYLDEKSCIEYMDFELPFTEVFDIDSLAEEQECDISFEVCDTDIALQGGSNRTISIFSDVRVAVRAECQQEIPILTDCYFTNADAELLYENYDIEEIASKPFFSTVMKEMIQHDSKLPEIHSVYSVVAKPYITSAQVQSGRIAVSGKTVIYILYTTEDKQIPVCSINEEIPFSYMIDSDGAEHSMEVLLNIECEHISYTINSAGNVEIRCGLRICGKVMRKYQLKAIIDVQAKETERCNKGIIIYFVKENDSLWEVAKRYHVKEDQIAECNSLEDGSALIKGEKLIIPIAN